MDDVAQAIGRLRRAQPRNPDTMTVCDRLEQLLACGEAVTQLAVNEPTVGSNPTGSAKFDKKTYQRDLMRKRRAAGKSK